MESRRRGRRKRSRRRMRRRRSRRRERKRRRRKRRRSKRWRMTREEVEVTQSDKSACLRKVHPVPFNTKRLTGEVPVYLHTPSELRY
jgi:hypothetical protein